LQALFLLKQLLILDADNVPLISPFSGEGGELILKNLHFCPQVGDSLVLQLLVLVLALGDVPEAQHVPCLLLLV
jgi:hypothetical protein